MLIILRWQFVKIKMAVNYKSKAFFRTETDKIRSRETLRYMEFRIAILLTMCSSRNVMKEWKAQHFISLVVLQHISTTFHCSTNYVTFFFVRLSVCLFWHRPFSIALPLVTSTQSHVHTCCCVHSCTHISCWCPSVQHSPSCAFTFDTLIRDFNCKLWLFSFSFFFFSWVCTAI